MAEPLPSPKSRLRPVYSVPDGAARISEAVIYQLEDLGDPVLRLRPTVREVDDNGTRRYLYRVAAFSRMTGARLGAAELAAPLGSEEEFAASSRAFQTEPFRRTLEALSLELRRRYAEAEAATPGPA